MQQVKKRRTITAAAEEKEMPKWLCGTAQYYRNNAAFWQNNKLLSAKSRIKVAICIQNATWAIAL